MAKTSIAATELKETRVGFLALVERGANRLPFRIVKEDKEMLDLTKLGSFLRKGETVKPEIVAAIVQDGSDLAALAKMFKAADLDPSVFMKHENDGFTVLAKAGYEGEVPNAHVIKASDEVSFVVTGLKKSFSDYDYSSTDFLTVLKTNGFYPSMWAAADAMQTAVCNAMYDAATPNDASVAISKIADDFKSYMTSVASSLPVHAFKLDTELKKADAGKNGTGAGFEHGKGTGTTPSATADDAKNTAIDATGSESTTGNANEGPVEAKKKEDDATKPVETEDDKKKKKEKEAAVTKDEVAGLPDPKGHNSGDGDGFGAAPADTARATAAATADDKKMTINGDPTGSTIPDGAGTSGLAEMGGVRKNEGDADPLAAPASQQLPDGTSGAGAQQAPDPQALAGAPLTKSDLSSILTEFAKLSETVGERFTALEANVTAVAKNAEKAVETARKADEAVNGTVFNEAGSDQVRAKKSDKQVSSVPPLMDTGFHGR